MKERIKELRNALKLTQSEFGKRIGLSRDGIAAYERGIANPTQSAIMMIVREFSVNEEWLRTGNGDMFLELDVSDEIAAFAGEVMHLDPSDPRVKVMRMLAKLPEEDWKAVADMIDLLKE